MTNNRSQVTNETSQTGQSVFSSRDPILLWLLVVDFVLFASGAIAHME
jgi:hypothetical protein